MKRLIVTADDVGLHPGMTAGAIRAHREGIVTACSLSPNGAAFDDAVARLREVPSLEVGVHLTLVEERALTTGRPMPRAPVGFILSSKKGIEAELRAQIERVLSAGLRVTHLNGHQHLHAWPAVSRIVRRLAREYGIGYVRRVRDRGGRAGLVRRASIIALGALSRQGTNDRTIGVLEAGNLRDVEPLLDFVLGITELVTHPGLGVDGYRHWGYDWEAETRALCEPRLREVIAGRGIELVAPSFCNC
ncbi:MAG TPA: ChbG/HpnK family deacetylase [Thermoanaerobaculia bacterium]|nr:ChbG/HpnK family deacetylase [Thermoanaerobaculia bacterium]